VQLEHFYSPSRLRTDSYFLFVFFSEFITEFSLLIKIKWLETGKGEMFVQDTTGEIEEIVNLYRQLNPFFKGYFKRQLLEIINCENGTK